MKKNNFKSDPIEFWLQNGWWARPHLMRDKWNLSFEEWRELVIRYLQSFQLKHSTFNAHKYFVAINIKSKVFFWCVIMVRKHGLRIQLSFLWLSFFFCIDDKTKSKLFKCVVVPLFFSLLFLCSVPFICLFAFRSAISRLFFVVVHDSNIVYRKKGELNCQER